MYIHTVLKLFTSLTGLAVAAGCANTVTGTDDTCSIGAQCQLTGALTILRGMPASVGILATAEGCIRLALPPEIYHEFSRWNDQLVVVSGEGFAASDDPDVTWVQLKDRQVATGACNSAPVVLYVTRIKKR